MELFDSRNDFRGDCLKLARLAKGVSGEELAAVLGVTKQFVSKLERGYPPTSSAVSALADFLDVEESFFFSARQMPLDSEHCHFRSKRSRTQTLTNSILARAEILDKLISSLEQEIILPQLNIPDTACLPSSSDNEIERIAEECRRYWGLGLGPISSMVDFVESIGVVVAHVADVDDRIDAFTVNNKRPLIIRNSAKKSVCRFRSDLGHELGHLVLHEGVVTGDKLTEHQADHFSSAFLVPRVSFLSEFPKMRGVHIDWNALIDFKLRWKISLRMCLYRASVLGAITPNQMRTGFIHLNSKGFVKEEKGDEHIPNEEPKVLRQAIEMLDLYTWEQVLKTSGIKSDFVKTTFGVNRPTFENSENLVSIHKYKNFG
ncbi:ImmA/IrrE family metallo-endopeptidase [Raoultella ornithinolytica]|uniref:helix-turn-helix domain-containing protein n=1 Tax=Klebsiella/Raoultella group TaxID=2890311 RepID=UPI00111B217B|nr:MULTISPECIES: XRE family transcriptional regulator [Klebsiella/Raoultella group]EJD6653645.1 ImmA/IrrE family metallo-endopeptidase [Raoultella ornithinolytica]ELV3660530.1 ImmA/IrrE family metallo-endopeptidase [Raoultella ornithinolytica]MEB8016352.1 XRE family transcriptional regulator [Raoultella ornithinolytica]